ncbi:MAG: hypothetical protein C5B50_26865 [Verrucomicrobia bacterium]|nr:MAG: hypothetical protein C5B50_26865 [Verrucomicrobiota bacterium]
MLPFRKITAARVLLATACIFVVSSTRASSALTVAIKGKTGYRIVIATNAIPSERYAAEELQRYLAKISGAKLPIITDAERPKPCEIILGDNAHLHVLGLKCDSDKLGTDGFILRTDHNRLIVLGGKPRGTLYAVYTLLEEKLGVRWFTPEIETVPKQKRLVLPGLNETQVPALEYREVFWTEMLRDADFAAKHRLNGHHYALKDKHGGRAVVYYPFVHSLDHLIPPELFKEHPDYFPLINGQRTNGYVQRCLSNPDVVQLAIKTVRQWIEKHPEVTIVSVSQNDTFKYCECAECKKLDDAEGSHAASLIRFVNAIAEDIEHDYPNVRIDTLAYQYTRKPPKTLRPRHNVIIRICSIECCFAHPLNACPSEENRQFRDDIIAWQPVAPLLYVWDYTPNFAHYEQPFPNFDVLQPNVRFFVEHNVKGLFEQGNSSPGGYGEMGPLRGYLLAKLLWHPDADLAKHTHEFCDAYFGKAAPIIMAYLELLEDQVRDGRVHAHVFDWSKKAYLNDGFLSEAEKLFDQAEQLAENDSVRQRVQVARLPIWYVKLVTDRVTGDAKAELLKQFLQVARKASISNISERGSLDEWAKKMGEK